MTKPLLVLIMMFLPWLPWTAEAKDRLRESGAIVHFATEPLAGRGTCCGQEPSLSVSPTAMPEAVPMVISHETQHLLWGLYSPKTPSGEYDYFAHFTRWGGFSKIAIACAKEVRPKALPGVLKFARQGPWQLHAQLPWLLKGKLCPKLQPWYPWFELDEKIVSGPHSSPIHRHTHLQ